MQYQAQDHNHCCSCCASTALLGAQAQEPCDAKPSPDQIALDCGFPNRRYLNWRLSESFGLPLHSFANTNDELSMTSIPVLPQYFHGAISVEKTSDGLRPWRLPQHELGLHHPGIVNTAGSPAGVRLSLLSDCSGLDIAIQPVDHQRQFDCYINGTLHKLATLKEHQSVLSFQELPNDEKLIEIWLPQNHAVCIQNIALNEGATYQAYHDERLRWLTYGSSITQCGAAHSPSRTWPAIVARSHNLNLCCMGQSGNCHLEPLVAKCLSEQEADIITLKLGINVYGNGSLNPRTYFPAVIGLIQRIRERHPKTPIGVITSIFAAERETNQNAVGMTLPDYREQTREAVKRLQDHGVKHLHLFEGLDMFGAEHHAQGYLPDNLHPNGDGYEIMGNNIAELVLKPLLDEYFPDRD